MASLDKLKERVEELTRRHKQANDRRSKLVGKLEEKRAELFKLKEEVKDAGLDPKNLKAEKQRLEEELQKLIESFEKELSVVEDALNEYEK